MFKLVNRLCVQASRRSRLQKAEDSSADALKYLPPWRNDDVCDSETVAKVSKAGMVDFKGQTKRFFLKKYKS